MSENPAVANAANGPEAKAEAKEQVQVQPANAESSGQTQEPSVADVMASNARLLEESRKYKERAQKAEKAIEERERKTAEEQGRYKELFEKAEAKLQNYQKLSLQEKIKNAVGAAGQKHGCVDSEALIKLGNHGLIQYDEETLEIHGAEIFVEEAKKAYPYLFKQSSQSVINPVAPGGAPALTKDPRKYTVDDKKNLMTEGLESLYK